MALGYGRKRSAETPAPAAEQAIRTLALLLFAFVFLLIALATFLPTLLLAIPLVLTRQTTFFPTVLTSVATVSAIFLAVVTTLLSPLYALRCQGFGLGG